MGIGFMGRVVGYGEKWSNGLFIRIKTRVHNEGVVNERGMCVLSIGQQELRWTQSIMEGIYVSSI